MVSYCKTVLEIQSRETKLSETMRSAMALEKLQLTTLIARSNSASLP